jgi:hypothetical protein
MIPAAALGAPGAPDPGLAAALAIATLSEAAGEDMRMTSLALDVASHIIGEDMVRLAVQTDKRARSIVFVSLEARVGSTLVFSAQGLFGRSAAPP